MSTATNESRSIFSRAGEPEVYFPFIALLVLIVLPFLIPLFFIHILIMIFLFAIVGSAWNLIGGYAGQLSLGHAAFFGIGAYTSTMLLRSYGLSPWVGMIFGGCLAVAMSLLLGAICFRLRGPYFAIATIGLAEVLRLLALHFRGWTNGAIGLTIPFKGSAPLLFQFTSKVPYYFISLLFLLATLFIVRRVENSRLGNYLMAIGQDQDAAEAIGIDSAKAKRGAGYLSALITGMAGTFYAQYVYFIEPESVFGLGLSIQIALVAILGGVGTVWGPVVGAAIIESLTQFTQYAFAGTIYGLEQIVYGSFLVAVILVRPLGVIQWVQKAYGRWLRLLGGKNAPRS
jgi:branched-chain amino acid transport system permease protein